MGIVRSFSRLYSFIFSLVWGVLAGTALWVGVQGLVTYFQNPKPITLSCSQVLKPQAQKGWVKLSTCRLLLRDAVFVLPSSPGESIKRALIPVLGGKQPTHQAPVLALDTKDPRWTKVVNQMRRLTEQVKQTSTLLRLSLRDPKYRSFLKKSKGPMPEEQYRKAQQSLQAFLRSTNLRPVVSSLSGMLVSSDSLSSNVQSHLSRKMGRSYQFKVLKHNQTPTLWWFLTLVVLGSLIGLGVLGRLAMLFFSSAPQEEPSEPGV